MRKMFKKMYVFVLLFVVIMGCYGVAFAKSNEDGDNGKRNNNIAVISIKTKDNSPNVLDFIDKPVSSHISKNLFMWNRNQEIPPAPYYEDCLITVTDSDGNVSLKDVDASVKVRGNWTSSYDKKPLRIKFDEKQNMLGLDNGAKIDNWLLLAEYKDGSMLRNKSAFAMSREILGEDGLYCSDAEFVELYANDVYYGVYLLAQMQQIDENGVNISKTKENYTGTDIGYFLEFDGYYMNEDELQRFKVDYNDNAPLIPYDGNGGSGRTVRCLKSSRWDMKQDVGMTISNEIYSIEQRDFIANFINGVYKIMYEASYNNKAFCFDDNYAKLIETKDISPREAIEKVVNVESLVDMYIISELTCDADIAWSSFFMSVDFGENGDKKLTFQAPWDFDSSMGNKNRCLDGNGFYASNIVADPNANTTSWGGGMNDTVNPWLVVLAYNDWYQDMIKNKWTRMYDNGVFDRVNEMIENDSVTLKDAFIRNYGKWNNIINNHSFVSELSSEAKKCKTQEEAAAFLADWLKRRVNFLNSQWHK